MKLQQLTYVCAIVDNGLNVTHAAKRLHTSQPGISRYVRMLESELGVEIFIRDKKRIAGLTPVGHSVYAAARRALNETENVKRVVDEFLSADVGNLTVATSHTHARYSLPAVIERFIERFPRVRLRLRQGTLSQISSWASTGEADISIAAPSSDALPGLVFLPCGELHRVVLTKPGHPLLKVRKVTIEELSSYPIITYDYEFSARSQIMRAFHRKRLVPNIVLSATDADTMKTYVHCGLGIGIMANTAFDMRSDRGLRAIDARHLFESNPVYIGLRRNVHLPKYMLHFIELYAPHLSRAAVERVVYENKP